MVLGLFKDAFSAEEAVTNLIEAEFPPSTISLVGQNKHEIQEIGTAKGSLMHTPLKDLSSTLTKHGLDQNVAQTIEKAVQDGNILLVLDAEEVAEDVGKEMLADAGAQQVNAFIA